MYVIIYICRIRVKIPISSGKAKYRRYIRVIIYEDVQMPAVAVSVRALYDFDKQIGGRHRPHPADYPEYFSFMDHFKLRFAAPRRR